MMSRPVFVPVFLAVSLAGLLTVLGCGDNDTTSPETSVVAVEVSPALVMFSSHGETRQLAATARDAEGNEVTGKAFEWVSADLDVAIVSSSGLVSAVADGSTTITVTTDGVDGFAAITVGQAQGGAILAGHEATAGFSLIPASTFEFVRNNYRIYYGSTSHGYQIDEGLGMLVAENQQYAPPTFYREAGDLGFNGDVTWAATTRAFLDAHPGEYDVVMWSWCGGVSTNTEQGINTYLNTMAQLEVEYPDIVFIYMTGHLNGTGVDGNLYARNNQIRAFAAANGKVLFDFADIESYDPAGTFYPNASDACEWCSAWCSTHICPACATCAHSHCFNCYRKGKAFWWMMARISGW